MIKVTVRKIDKPIGVLLPAEAAANLKVREGDRPFLTHSPEGFRLTPYEPDFARPMKVAEAGMKEYHNALRELAR